MKPVKKDFIHLHNHSEYSLPNGMSSIRGMVEKAKNLGMKHLAITDNGTLFGALHFYRECKANDIIPIIGCSFEVAFGNKSRTHLILLAKNYTGYKNLMLLSSKACTEGFHYKPIIDDESLIQYSSDLICISSCQNEETLNNQYKEVQKRAEHYQSIFGKDNFYLELQDHGKPEQKIINEQLIKLSKETGIPLVATNNTHYPDREDAKARDILFSIRMEQKKAGVILSRFSNGEYYMKTEEGMSKIFKDIPEAISNTIKIAESCNLQIALPGPLLPDYPIPEEFDNSESYLRFLTHKGLSARYSEITDEVKNRADYELDIIICMGFTEYFLIVWDYVNYARENDIPVGPGRGPSASSLVAYVLGITDIDPLEYGLLFERFINPERISMPVFDIDFCFNRRQEVIDYVTQKYGSDRVCRIIAFGTLMGKGAIRDVAGVLGFSSTEAAQISRLIPPEYRMTIERAMDREPELKELEQKGAIYKELIDTTKSLEDLIRHSATHSAGIVISRTKLTDYTALYKDPKTESIVTQYTMNLLEDCGLVQFDFLGLRILTDNKKIEVLIKKKYPDFEISQIPIDDEETLDIFRKGNTKNIIQFSSSGMRDNLKQLNPDSIEDLMALNALYRPGPIQFIPTFIEYKNNQKMIKYPDTSLEDILKSTYGVIVYQEQVMRIAQIIGGFSLGKADILRRAMGKKKVREMDKMKIEFLEGAVLKGFTTKKAEDIFEMLVPFAGYGFNKSHAAAYTMLAYKTAYLKAHYPEEFQIIHSDNIESGGEYRV
ncbi:MAG: DNA polymerase III subunit alpha [Spirochaetia bacterium]|nr:DNA polymerase III subunit alpha [Spirochaetia bacterium]